MVFLVSFLLLEYWPILVSFLPKPWLHNSEWDEALAKHLKNFLVQIIQCSNEGIHCDIYSYICSDTCLDADESQMSHSLLWVISNDVRDLFSLERIYAFKVAQILGMWYTVNTCSMNN